VQHQEHVLKYLDGIRKAVGAFERKGFYLCLYLCISRFPKAVGAGLGNRVVGPRTEE
jgi:hypothetical protein